MNTKTPAIGCLMDNLSRKYQYQIFKGLCDTADRRKVNLFFFPGGNINSRTNFEYQANILYDLAALAALDVLIVATNTISSSLTEQELADYFRNFAHVPVLSIGLELPGKPAITIDNKTGMEQLLHHLLGYHHYKNIAFITGPAKHHEAIIRLDVTKKIMSAYGLELRPEYIEAGNFLEESGYNAMHRLLDKRLTIDAVIAASDLTAIGAVNAIQERKLRTPDDIAVVGFDDIYESSFFCVPLTTVNQPLFWLGQQAVDTALMLLSESNTTCRTLPTHLIIRKSCGCRKYDNELHYPKKCFYLKKSIFNCEDRFKKDVTTECLQIISLEYKYADVKFFRAFLTNMAGSFLRSLEKKEPLTFLACFDNLMENNPVRGDDDFRLYNKVLDVLRNNFIKYAEDKDLYPHVESILEKTRSFVAESAENSRRYQFLKNEDKFKRISEIGSRLSSSFDREKLFIIILESLQQIEIESGYLCLYRSAVQGELAEKSGLHLIYRKNKKPYINIKGLEFPTMQLLPFKFRKNIETPGKRVVLSLYFENEQIGFLILTFIDINPSVHDILQKQISSALKGSFLVNEIKQHTDNLEDQIAERTRELTKVNKQLREENKQRIKAEITIMRSRETLKSIIDAMPVPLLVIRIFDGQILYLNNPFTQFLKIPEEQIIKNHKYNFNDFFSDAKIIKDILDKLKTSNKVLDVELPLTVTGTRKVWVIASFQRLIFQDEDCAIAGFSDITERKELEKAIAEIRENEQRRIGQDLHDDICQRLAGIAVMLSVLEEKLKNREDAESKRAAYISALLNDAISQVKNIARGLYPMELENVNLRNVLEDFSRKIEDQHGIRCTFKSNLKEEIDTFVTLHLYRIAQEAISNALNHGKPSLINIELMKSKRKIELNIIDNGSGIPANYTSGKGIGIRTMHYRAKLIGGELLLKPGQSGGTILSCII